MQCYTVEVTEAGLEVRRGIAFECHAASGCALVKNLETVHVDDSFAELAEHSLIVPRADFVRRAFGSLWLVPESTQRSGDHRVLVLLKNVQIASVGALSVSSEVSVSADCALFSLAIGETVFCRGGRGFLWSLRFWQGEFIFCDEPGRAPAYWSVEPGLIQG
ncbi:MAG: hypothetical protein K2Y32_11740 [Candidatus Obscuribacterales bacterium]|nr:hypothetical protein [Candidatus Obscuribacterales bacterium]